MLKKNRLNIIKNLFGFVKKIFFSPKKNLTKYKYIKEKSGMYTNELAILICPLSDLLKPYLKYIILIINNIDIANKNFESCFSKVFIPLIIRKPVIKKKITDSVDLI